MGIKKKVGGFLSWMCLVQLLSPDILLIQKNGLAGIKPRTFGTLDRCCSHVLKLVSDKSCFILFKFLEYISDAEGERV